MEFKYDEIFLRNPFTELFPHFFGVRADVKIKQRHIMDFILKRVVFGYGPVYEQG